MQRRQLQLELNVEVSPRYTPEGQAALDAFAAEVASNALGKLVQAVVLFDEYRGAGLEQDEKSLAFRFLFFLGVDISCLFERRNSNAAIRLNE